MYIYNVTSKVSWAIHDEWVAWMMTTHIREVMDTGLFVKYQLVRLHDVEEGEGPTYAVQYYLENRTHYDKYITEFASLFSGKVAKRWGDHIISFRTLMEVIN